MIESHDQTGNTERSNSSRLSVFLLDIDSNGSVMRSDSFSRRSLAMSRDTRAKMVERARKSERERQCAPVVFEQCDE